MSSTLRAWCAALLLIAGAALLAPVAPAAAADQYAVGKRSFTFVDATRPTSANGTYAGAPTRTLPVYLLYPAQGDPAGPIVDNAPAVATSASRRFPLVVFSHGFGASGPAYQIVIERLARRGYAVAAPTFPLSNGAAPGGARLTDYVNQPADVSFVISSVLRMVRETPDLKRSISNQRIGAAGHSLGAITTLGVATNSCCVDRRLRAAVAWSGVQLPFAGGSAFAGRTPPLMLVHGDADGTVPFSGSFRAYADAPAPKALVRLLGAGHVPFGPPAGDVVIAATAGWFDRWLKRDRSALERLPTETRVPGVSELALAAG
jgi:predicted dienelactone hydrolase